MRWILRLVRAVIYSYHSFRCKIDGCNDTESIWPGIGSGSTTACYRYNTTDPNLLCRAPNLDIDDVNDLEKCDQWTYDTSIFESTIVTDVCKKKKMRCKKDVWFYSNCLLKWMQFDLTCEDDGKAALSNSAYMVGMFIGSSCMGTLADMWVKYI